MTNDDPQKAEQDKPDWARLAAQALDLWQSHLTSLANDPKAKEEMARLIAPMTRMFVEWTDMVQQGMQGMAPYASETKSHDEPASPGPSASERAETAQPAGDVGGEPAANAVPVQPDPVATPVPEPLAESAVPGPRGDGAASDRARDLAELADRLAYLERELDGIRARRRSAEDGAEADRLDDRDVQRVVGAG